MAGLAGYVGVFSLALDAGLVRMARLTSFMAGKLDGAGAQIVHRSGPEVTVLAKFRWNNGAPEEKEGGES
jgi:hypothetical protein